MNYLKPNLRAEIRWQFARSSGPGGQNVNKVNSKATLTWNVRASKALDRFTRERFLKRFAAKIDQQGMLQLRSGEHREQHRNIIACEQRLARMLELARTPIKVRRATQATKSSKERRLQSKRQHSEIKRLRRKLGD